MDASKTDSGIDMSRDEPGQTTDRSVSEARVEDDSARNEMTPRSRPGHCNGSQMASSRSTSGNKARRPYVKEDPDRLYLESDGIVYEIEEAQEDPSSLNPDSCVQTSVPVRIVSWSVKPDSGNVDNHGSSSLTSRCRHCGRLAKTTRSNKSDVYDLVSYRKSWLQSTSYDGEQKQTDRGGWYHPPDLHGNKRAKNHCFLYNFGAWPVADRGLEVRPSTSSHRLQPQLPTTTPRNSSASAGSEGNRPLDDKSVVIRETSTSASAIDMIQMKQSTPDDPTLRRLGLIPVPAAVSLPGVSRNSSGWKRRSWCDCGISSHDMTLLRSPTAPEGLGLMDEASRAPPASVRGASSLPLPVRPENVSNDSPATAVKSREKVPTSASARTRTTDGSGYRPMSSRTSPTASKPRGRKGGLSRPGRLITPTSTNIDAVPAMTELTGTRVPLNSPDSTDRETGSNGTASGNRSVDDDTTEVGIGSSKHSKNTGHGTGNAVGENVTTELRREKSVRSSQVFMYDRSSQDASGNSIELLSIHALPMLSRGGVTANEVMSEAVVASLSAMQNAKVSNQTRLIPTCELVQWPDDIDAYRVQSYRLPTFDWLKPTIERPPQTAAAEVKPIRSITVVVPY